MALTKEDYKERMRLGRERAAQLRADGLLPPRKNAKDRPREVTEAADRPSPLTDTAEFAAAVAAEVRQQVQALLPTLAAAIPQNADRPTTDETLEKLAMLIAELTDQGSSAPKRIPPEILLARKAAHERMIKLIEKETRATQRDPRHVPPTFHLTSKIVVRLDDAGEQVVEPLWRGADNRTYPTELGWLGIPNLAMEPQNESAQAIMDAFKESIGNKAATSFKIRDKDPNPDEGIETEYGVTETGRLVTGGGVQQRKADLGLVDKVSTAMLTRRPDLDRAGPGYQAGRGVILNQGASLRQQHGVAPYKDVRVLGSIAPPARQNG